MQNPGIVKIANSQKSGHKLPDADCHGLILPTYSRTFCCGGVSSGKTLTALNIAARCHSWIPFDKVFLMSPNNDETSKGVRSHEVHQWTKRYEPELTQAYALYYLNTLACWRTSTVL